MACHCGGKCSECKAKAASKKRTKARCKGGTCPLPRTKTVRYTKGGNTYNKAVNRETAQQINRIKKEMIEKAHQIDRIFKEQIKQIEKKWDEGLAANRMFYEGQMKTVRASATSFNGRGVNVPKKPLPQPPSILFPSVPNAPPVNRAAKYPRVDRSTKFAGAPSVDRSKKRKRDLLEFPPQDLIAFPPQPTFGTGPGGPPLGSVFNPYPKGGPSPGSAAAWAAGQAW